MTPQTNQLPISAAFTKPTSPTTQRAAAKMIQIILKTRMQNIELIELTIGYPNDCIAYEIQLKGDIV